MVNTAYHDNSEVPHVSYDTPFETYIRGNYARNNIPTQQDMVDLKGPECYTGPKKTDDIVQNFLTTPKQQLDRLAETVNERATAKEWIFVGRHFDD